jgi:hypothetical protein
MTYFQAPRAFMNKSAFQRAPMCEDELRKRAPSIFAAEAHESRSARYTYIPTIDVVRAMVREGFQPYSARQSNTRDRSRAEHTKHMVRFRRPDMNVTVGDVIPEIVLVNSHDGTSSYQIMSGMFRVRCLNGLVVQSGTLEDVRVHHKGDVISNVIEGCYSIVEETTKALSAPADWSGITMGRDARMALAEAAHVLRFADSEGTVATPIKAEQLLIPRRRDDTESDLWTTFNVVQENTIRGGLSAMGRDSSGARRRSTSREVKGIDQDVRLNKALWTLSERMAEIMKSAH